MEKIKFVSDEMQEIEFFVLEQTKVNGMSYILVTDSEEGDAVDPQAHPAYDSLHAR